MCFKLQEVPRAALIFSTKKSYRFAKKSFQENCYHLPENVEFQAKASYYDDRIVNISCDEFEVGKPNSFGKYWGIVYEDAANHLSSAKPRYSTHYDYPYIVTTVR